MESDFKEQFRSRWVAERKRETWRFKRMQAESALKSVRFKKTEDSKRRATGRKEMSVALGVARCRKLRNQNQSEFADFLGISRRSLVNYETGRRAVGGDVLEKILADGKIKLHEVFNLSPEPVPIGTRLEIAELTVKLIASCLSEDSETDLDRVLSLVQHHVAWWPKSRRTSSRNLEKVANEIVDEINREKWEEEYWDQGREIV